MLFLIAYMLKMHRPRVFTLQLLCLDCSCLVLTLAGPVCSHSHTSSLHSGFLSKELQCTISKLVSYLPLLIFYFLTVIHFSFQCATFTLFNLIYIFNYLCIVSSPLPIHPNPLWKLNEALFTVASSACRAVPDTHKDTHWGRTALALWY
jgi:hypothetical protein